MALYGVLGDIHGNREALVAALGALDARGVHDILCVGDIVGYNADPDDCASIVRERGMTCISGNHDLIATRRLGFDRCSNKAMHALARTRKRLHADTADFLSRLPARLPIEDRVVLVHGGVRDVEQYMTRERHFAQNAAYLREDFPGRNICFFGHTHDPTVVEVDGDRIRELSADTPLQLRDSCLYFINAGSVDASRKRLHKRAEYAVFDSSASVVQLFNVSYNDALTESKAHAAGYRLGALTDRLYEVRRRIVGPRQHDPEVT